MRRLIILISLLLFSNSFSLIYQNYTSNGICELHGKYLPINSNYFVIDNKTFIKLYSNDTFVNYFYNNPTGNSSIFDWYQNDTGPTKLNSGILFVKLIDNSNFSIGDYIISYSNKTLKINNTNFNLTDPLLNVTFSNGNFTILNNTYSGEVVNVHNLTNFYISNFSECNVTSLPKVFRNSLSYRNLITNMTKFLLTSPIQEKEFLMDNGLVSDFKINDHLDIPGFNYTYNSTPICNSSLDKIILNETLAIGKSFFLSLQVINGTSGAFIYNWQNCSKLTYQKFLIGQENNDFNLSYKNGTIFVDSLMDLGSIEKRLFEVMGVNETNRYKLVYSNTTISVCNQTWCVKENGRVNEDISIIPEKKFVFQNDNVILNISDVVYFFNKSISILPILNNTSTDCIGNVILNGTNIFLSNMKNYQNCSFDVNLSYNVKNETKTYEIPIVVDEPQIKMSCSNTKCKYSINSTSTPHILVKEDNVIYNSNNRKGEFSVNPGKLYIIYGNSAGNKTKTLEIKSSTSSGHNSKSYSNSGITISQVTNSSNERLNKTNSSKPNNLPIKLLNKTNNTFSHNITTSVKVSGITGGFIDVNSKRLPWASWVAISLIFLLLLILKFYKKVDRRIIE